MRTWKRSRPWLMGLGAAGGSLALAYFIMTAAAQPPRPRSGESRTISGRVQSFTSAPMGEVDGLMLDDGTWVHWSPHLEGRFAKLAEKGDRVRVIGFWETGPKGDTKFEVQTLTNLRTDVTRANDTAPPFPRGKGKDKGKDRGKFARRLVLNDTRTVTGRVQRFTTAPKGEVDGLILDDGTWVHWPPHLEGRFANTAVKGDRIRASGAWETGPAGDRKFEVETLTKVNSDDASPRRATAGNRDERLRDLENRLEKLLDEVRQLRRER